MKVYIKEDRSIPEGYTYRRCDTYTAEELVAACSLPDEHSNWRDLQLNQLEVPRQNPHAVEYVKIHPRKTYTQADRIAIMAIEIRGGKA